MAKPLSPIRLLLVDADEAARTLLRRRFTRLGVEVMEAAEGDKALGLIAMIPFETALVDLETPGPDGGDGFDIIRRMRETRSAAELPIIAVASEAAGDEAVEALRLGATDCVARPLDLETAYGRVMMQLTRKREADPTAAAMRELRVRLESLKQAVADAEATSIVLHGLGHEVRAPLNGLIGAAASLMRICQTPELKLQIDAIEQATGALDLLMVQALGRTDRRNRAPKPTIRVLLADDDAGGRLSMRGLLHATETSIELIEASSGLQAAVATETHFFDLILVSLAAPEAIAGIRAIRRAERQNRTRRTPILAYAPDSQSTAQTLDAGADLCMPQPVTAERVLCALAEAFDRESHDIGAVA
jgi:DNA-binding response OmpR family regulator